MFLATLGTDIHLHDTYFVVAHFHYIMVGGAIMGYLGGLHYWWPKMVGRMYSEFLSRVSAILVFVGFNLTFFPQFIVGYVGMPRRYHAYPPEFQVLNVMSSAGATILGVGYVLPVLYFLYSLKKGEVAGPNPWGAAGLEWEMPSPPPTENFPVTPRVTTEPYEFTPHIAREGEALSDAVVTWTRTATARRAPSGAAASIRDAAAAEGGGRPRDVGLPAHRNPVFRWLVHGLHALPHLVPRRVRRRELLDRDLLGAVQHGRAHRQLADHGDGGALGADRASGKATVVWLIADDDPRHRCSSASR